MGSPRLIVVDDEEDLAGFVSEVAEREGFQTELFHRADSFKNAYANRHPTDVIVLDLMLPDIDGVELIRHLSEIGCNAQLILVSGFDEGVLHSAEKIAIERGLNYVGKLNKPFRRQELSSLLSRVSTATHVVNRQSSSYQPDEADLRAAITNREIIVHYQPKIHLLSGQVKGFEALVRWQHPRHGLLYPISFLTIAEKSGLIGDLTWCVLKQVTEQCQRWGHKNIKIPVSVNMSGSTISDLTLPEKIAELLQKHRIDPRLIILEMTESTVMEEFTESLDILTRLRMKGFRLSIDDFGTGYSSLVQLHRAPFSELKIDKSFVTNIIGDKEAFVIVEAVIALAQKLDLLVVAEGVETEQVLDLLTGMGCDMAQGYYISEPMPAHEVSNWLSERPAHH